MLNFAQKMALSNKLSNKTKKKSFLVPHNGCVAGINTK